MHPRTKVKNAAIQLRNKLSPVMPTVRRNGKAYKILPVVFIRHEPPNDPVVMWAVPDGTKIPSLPSQINGCELRRKAWEGHAPEDIQKLALKIFPAK